MTRLVVGTDKESDARRFVTAMKARLEQFSLALHPEKTRVLEFGRFAAANRAKRGQGKPQTFKLPGLHAHQRERPARQVVAAADHPTRSHGRGVEADQGRTAAALAPVDPRARALAAASGSRLHGVPRRARQLPEHESVSRSCHGPVASGKH